MKIDTAAKLFVERYDQEAIESIDHISRDFGLNVTGATIKGFNINEAFSTFNEYLHGYANYMCENKDNKDASPAETINESVKMFIESQVIKEADMRYESLPGFVRGYIEGCQTISECVDDIKRQMTDAGVQVEAVGIVNEYVDMFMDKIQESFDPTMDRILWASGYNSKKKLSGNIVTKPQPVFL